MNNNKKMKVFIQIIFCICLHTCYSVFGQTITIPSTTVTNTGSACLGSVSYTTSTGSGNPTTNNNSGMSAITMSTEADNATSGWTAMTISGTSSTANKWSSTTGTIPFPFYFYGEMVTGFKVAYNGLLTFNTSTTTNPPTGNNAAFPSTSLPDKTIGYWDYYWACGTNDKVYYKITGSSPNMQLWIKWYAVDMGSTSTTTSKSTDNYFAFVLEETSNNIYFVDMTKNSTKALTASLGIQYNSTYYSNYASSLALSSTSSTTNKYYKFAYNETSISYSSSLSYTYSQLPSSGAYLELPQEECVTSTLNSAYLDVLVDLGSDFALGDAITNTTSLLVTLTGYSTSSCTAVFTGSQTITMNSANNEVEKLTRINLDPYSSSVDYDDLDYIKVTVARNTADASPTSLRVQAWVETDFSYNALSGDYDDASMINLTSATQSHNEVTFSWTSECEMNNHYQLQVLRIYNLSTTNNDQYYVYNNDIDWDKALSIEVEDATTATLYMGEGTGYYAWRVRPIGNKYDNGIGDSRNWGVWSDHQLVDPVDDGSSLDFIDDEYPEIGYYEENSTSGLPDYVFYFTHTEEDKNWIYNRQFSECNSIGEKINYASGLNQIKQSQQKLSEQDSILVNEKAYDYCDRPAIQSLTAPYKNNYLTYVEKVLQDKDGNIYGPEDFDSEDKTKFDDDIADVPIWENPLKMYGPISDYYSDANSDLRIPNAGNFPYARTLYHQDGRVKKQSLYGDEHRMGLYDTTYIKGGMQRTVRTYYSAVADSELLKVFGNETPHDTNVYKIIRVDPNEIPTVEYKTIDGKTIATAFVNTGSHPLLTDITSNPTVLTTKEIQGNSYPDPNTVVREQSIAFVEPTTQIDLDYFFNINEFRGECLNYCSTCDYKVYIYIIREETDEYKYLDSIIVGANSCGGNVTETYSPSTIMLSDPGVYRFGRKITVNNKKEGEQTYADYHADSIGTAMDSTVLTRFDQFKAYLNGDNGDEPDLDALNEYLDELAGISTSVGSGISLGSGGIIGSGSGTSGIGSNLTVSKTLSFFNSSSDDDVTVTYDEDKDEYTISTSCCSATIPKVTCDEDLCDDLWVLESPGAGQPLVEGQTYVSSPNEWQQTLIDDNGGYYDFESLLYASDVADDNNLEHLSQFFYDQYGKPIYPYNVKAEATIDISTNNQNCYADGDEELIWFYDGSDIPSFSFNLIDGGSTLMSVVNLSPITVGCNVDMTGSGKNGSHGESQCGTGGNSLNRYSVTLSDYADKLADYLREMLSTYGYSVESKSVGTSADPEYRITLTNYYSGDVVPSFDHTISISNKNYINADVTEQVTNIETGDYTYGDGALNLMLNHMIFEKTDPYSCTDILTAMEQFIDDWSALYATKGAPDYIGTNFLDYFLELCGGKQLSGFSNYEYGTESTGISGTNYNKSIDGTSYGYLEYAYRSSKFDYEVGMETGLELSTTQENCLNMYGASLTKEIKNWSNPEDDGNDSAAWNTTSCGSAAWWSGSSGIADERDEALQCKVWEQLYVCLQTQIESEQTIIKVSDCDDPSADPTSCQTALQALAIDKIQGIATMRDASIRNRISEKVSLTDETSIGIASDAVIDAVTSKYIQTSLLKTSNRTTLFTNIDNLKKIVYGDIDVRNYTGVSAVASGYVKINAFSTTKASFVAACLNDSLTAYSSKGKTPSKSTLESWLTNIGTKFSISTTSTKTSTFTLLSVLVTPASTASFIASSAGIIKYKSSSTATAASYFTFSGNNTTYTIPAMEYKVGDRISLSDIARLRGLSAHDCNQDNIDYLLYKLDAELSNCRQDEIDSVLSHYQSACTVPSEIEDSMTIRYGVDYVNFTLFYYDVSGNLIKVVPPKGVDMVLDANGDGKLDSKPSRENDKNHTYLTQYKYNSLGQCTYETTPDGGEKELWYNSVGQLRFSQNAKQKAEGNYAYLKYDDLGRLIETGLSTKDVSSQGFSDEGDDQDYPTTGLSDRVVSIYDEEVTSLYYISSSSKLEQHYIQNRISYAYSDPDGTNANGDEIYTYYSYDPDGNVEWMLQSIPGMNKKYIEYEYDLIANKVTKVSYNSGMNDQFFYKYNYDSDYRIKSVQTSKDDYLWDTDAEYIYYAYGPLKRMSIGEDHIQGLDYVYTINGWLKAINHQALNSTYDPGGDGGKTSSTAKDVFGMSLGYFDGDFKRKYTSGTTTYSPFNSDYYTEFGSASSYYNTGTYQHDWNTSQGAANEKNGTAVSNSKVNYRPLYNGSITNFTYQQTKVTGTATTPALDSKPLCFMYNYDELYRLTQANFDYYNSTNWYRNTIASSATYNGFKSSYSYDLNGNITGLNRYNYSGTQFDALTYNYTSGTNQLSYVDDTKSASLLTTDIDDQSAKNYTYDEIGELITDSKETISDIDWTVLGKVSKVTYTSGKNIRFSYDAEGNRVCKKVYTSSTDAIPDVSNYVYDANRRVMGIYENTSATSTDYDLSEMPLYTSKRIGMYKPNSKVDDEVVYTDAGSYTRVVGEKRYEITDYLGNVREVVNDIKEPVSGGGYTAKVVVSNDYYPYGMMLPNRNEGESSYRYGYEGKEHDDEIKTNANSYDFDARFYDPRLGRWLSRDPKDSLFPSMSPYNAFNDNPLFYIDPTGEAAIAGSQLKEAAAAKTDVQKGTRALFALTATLQPGDELSGAELVSALPPDFRSGSPGTYAQLKRVKSISNNDGVITVVTTDEKPLTFGSDEGGYIIVSSGATFKVSATSSSVSMSSVSGILLSSDKEGSWGSSTAMTAAVVKKTGDSHLSGKLKDVDVNFGDTVLGP